MTKSLQYFNVSLGTLRIIFLHRGKKLLVPILGFIEPENCDRAFKISINKNLDKSN